MFRWWTHATDKSAAGSVDAKIDQVVNTLHTVLARLMSLERTLNLQYLPPAPTPGTHIKLELGPRCTKEQPNERD